MSDTMLSTEELAEYLNVSRHTLARWASHGTGPRYFRIGRHRRYALEDVQAFLDAQSSDAGVRAGSTPAPAA